MIPQSKSYRQTVRELYRPRTVRKQARELADIAAAALLNRTGPVRRPGSAALARAILKTKPRGLTSLAREIQKASLSLSNPNFIAQQVGAPIPAAALVESVVAALNQSIAVWEMSPIGTAIDRDLMARFTKLFGFPREASGSMVPGGAFGNLTALFAAREALAPDSSKGVAIIAGAQTHYSISRSAAILGIGRDAVFQVPMDGEFRTDVSRVPKAFSAARNAGYRKFILVGSAGFTPTGSFDDFVVLRELASRHKAWFHIDAAHGAGLAFSRGRRHLLEGIGAADSISFDPHKMMFQPLSAGAVLGRDGALLAKPLQDHAPYLFGSEREWPDVGQYTIACSQRFDALKVWLLWRVYGARIWDALVTHVCDVCEDAWRYCEASEVLAPLHKPHSNILCFHAPHLADPDGRLHWDIKEKINESGSAYISSTVLRDRRVLRMVVMNPLTQTVDVRRALRAIERLVR